MKYTLIFFHKDNYTPYYPKSKGLLEIYMNIEGNIYA